MKFFVISCPSFWVWGLHRSVFEAFIWVLLDMQVRWRQLGKGNLSIVVPCMYNCCILVRDQDMENILSSEIDFLSACFDGHWSFIGILQSRKTGIVLWTEATSDGLIFSSFWESNSFLLLLGFVSLLTTALRLDPGYSASMFPLTLDNLNGLFFAICHF